ncbi:hypothetical protein SAY86_022385 [Trapa natans]|uniref:DUF659 domain-containing protein n=1 Tax=Trapa natans TaxID=22666 RepID=A0AAN7M904_TRANT|nr:hypothetical protein SAY86_022385 [Trapa natans]
MMKEVESLNFPKDCVVNDRPFVTSRVNETSTLTIGGNGEDYLEGNILQTLSEVQDYVESIKQSWTKSGCSIILDTWTDEQGRQLMNFLVSCPEGTIYLKSCDISSRVLDLEALYLMLNEVIEELGAENVVQIIACSTIGWLWTAGEQFISKFRTGFWSVSASYCINLMLEKIELMDSIKPLLEKATTLKKFVLSLVNNEKFYRSNLRMLCSGIDSATTAFITLQEIVNKKDELEELFTSSLWKESVWATMEEGKQVAELVMDPSFWTSAMMVLNASWPLIRALNLIQMSDKPFTGYIYETMDKAKEAIQKALNNKKSQYMPFWEAIDDIWNNHLHSPLHAAGYFFNPDFFYSRDFYSDPEVAFGVLCCVVRIVHDENTKDRISLQLDKYRKAEGAFNDGCSINCRKKHPISWWSIYGRDCPELQSFAIRILSQTIEGPSAYGLKREMAERLLASEMDCEKDQLRELAFVHYNLQLKYLSQKVKKSENDSN